MTDYPYADRPTYTQSIRTNTQYIDRINIEAIVLALGKAGIPLTVEQIKVLEKLKRKIES
jgi:hypothetical protein